jgi:hypothetical protein
VAFRATEFADLCHVCRDPTDDKCLRCGMPLCERHAPAPGYRCSSCELEFEAARRPMVDPGPLIAAPEPPASAAPRTWLLLALTASVVFGLTLTVSTDVFFALLLGVPMACLGGVEVARSFSELVFRHRILEERMLRRQFLAERKAHLSLRHPRSMALRAKSAS